MTKKTYDRTTPVERVLKNVEKAKRAVGLAAKRMRAWAGTATPSEFPSPEAEAIELVKEAYTSLEEALDMIHDSSGLVASLVERGWQPPAAKFKASVPLEPGDLVTVSEKHLAKYSGVYSARALSLLTVDKLLEKGVAVRYAPVLPNEDPAFFIVPKGHLVRRAA